MEVTTLTAHFVSGGLKAEDYSSLDFPY